MESSSSGARDADAGSAASAAAAGGVPTGSLVWWPAAVAGICALAVYGLCLAPGLTWAHDGADGGDLLAAALVRGVPHPTGYPTYQLLLRAAIALLPVEPARAGNWLSAACAAAAAALVADTTMRMLPARPWRGFIALFAALAWALAPTVWSQAVIAEVYSLYGLMVALLLWLLWRWREAASTGGTAWPWLAGAGFLFGAGLGNQSSFLLMVPGAAAWLWLNRRKLKLLPPSGWAAICGATVLGLSTYLYLPAAAMGSPPVNWGDPSTPRGFWWVISGELYRPLVFGLGLQRLPARVAAWASEAARQYGGGPWGAVIAVAGLFWLDQHDRAWWWTTLLVGLAYSLFAIGYNSGDSYVYLIPVWVVGALWLAAGLTWGVDTIGGIAESRRGGRVLRSAAWVIIIALPVLSLVRFWDQMDLSRDHEAPDWVSSTLASADPGAVILTQGDRTTFALWYAVYGLRLRPDLTPINVNLYAYDWYQRALMHHHAVLTGYAREGKLPPLEQIVPELSSQRPVYRAEPMDLDFANTAQRSAGPLVQILPR
jgi:hypothetical protein